MGNINDMKRIVLFSDSLALPRNIPEITTIEDTYPFLLKQHFEVFQFSKGGGLIGELLEQSFYYSQYKPDYIIIHCGIVDCAPRAFSFLEESIMRYTRVGRLFRKIISKIITTKRIRNIRKCSWTPLKSFENACKQFIKQFEGIPVYALSILPASMEYEQHVPGISEKISKYNDVLRNVFENRWIDLSNIPMQGIMSDYHHLTKEGHSFVFMKIIDKIGLS